MVSVGCFVVVVLYLRVFVAFSCDWYFDFYGFRVLVIVLFVARVVCG